MKSAIQDFYNAFNELDAEAMTAFYHHEIRFYDPAFGMLEGSRVTNMWKMLCQSQKGKDFKVTVANVEAGAVFGRAEWMADYTFGKTGRKVHNIIQATFEFKDQKIIQHHDYFDIYRWSRQALGLQGLLIGWTPFFQKKLQAQTNNLLDQFEQKLAGENPQI